VIDITLLDSWVISAQGHFTKNTDLFPGKISKNLKRCPLKAIIRDKKSIFATKYVKHTYSNGSVVWYIEGFEYELLRIVLHQMNMTLDHVLTPERGWQDKLFYSFFENDPFIAVGDFGKTFPANLNVDFTSSYFFARIRWYVPCSIKYPRWSSILRIHSVELWLVLIVSIVIAATSITLVGR